MINCLLGIQMNTYEILASQKDIISFFMSIPDEVFFLRIGNLDVKSNKIKPYKALDALTKIGEILGMAFGGDTLMIESLVNRTGPIIQKASILLTPKDDYTLIGIRYVDKPVRKEEKTSNSTSEMSEERKQSGVTNQRKSYNTNGKRKITNSSKKDYNTTAKKDEAENQVDNEVKVQEL